MYRTSAPDAATSATCASQMSLVPARPHSSPTARATTSVESGGDGQFHALEFVVDGGVGNGDGVDECLVSGINGGFAAQDDLSHEFDSGGEEEITRVLALRGLVEESVEGLGVEDAFEDFEHVLDFSLLGVGHGWE